MLARGHGPDGFGGRSVAKRGCGAVGERIERLLVTGVHAPVQRGAVGGDAGGRGGGERRRREVFVGSDVRPAGRRARLALEVQGAVRGAGDASVDRRRKGGLVEVAEGGSRERGVGGGGWP